MTREKSEDTLITEIKGDLDELKRRGSEPQQPPVQHTGNGLANLKNISGAIVLIIGILGGTWGMMSYLFVTKAEYREALADARRAREINEQKLLHILQNLDKDVQRNEIAVARNRKFVIDVLRRHTQSREELIKVMERLRIAPPPEMKWSSFDVVSDSPGHEWKIESRIKDNVLKAKSE